MVQVISSYQDQLRDVDNIVESRKGHTHHDDSLILEVIEYDRMH